MTRISVQLPGDALTALADLSAREWRSPNDQAAVLILEGLHRRRLANAPTVPGETLPPASREPEALAR